jgi:hypothetical protein
LNGPKTLDPEAFKKQLLGFNRKVAHLEQSRYFRSRPVMFEAKRAPGRILSVEKVTDDDGEFAYCLELEMQVSEMNLRFHDRDNLDAFILTYRMLVQKNDRFSIRQLAERYQFVHYIFRDAFYHLQDLNAEFLDSPSGWTFREEAISRRDFLDTIIYGELAHSTEEKANRFASWTEWENHEKALWLLFDHTLRTAMEALRHFRDINAATLMLHFGIPVTEETVYRRLQEKRIIRKDLTFEEAQARREGPARADPERSRN